MSEAVGARPSVTTGHFAHFCSCVADSRQSGLRKCAVWPQRRTHERPPLDAARVEQVLASQLHGRRLRRGDHRPGASVIARRPDVAAVVRQLRAADAAVLQRHAQRPPRAHHHRLQSSWRQLLLLFHGGRGAMRHGAYPCCHAAHVWQALWSAGARHVSCVWPCQARSVLSAMTQEGDA